MEYYAKDCELVIGLVSPVGVNLEDVQNRLDSIFKQFRYEMNFIHLSEISKEFINRESDSTDELSRLDQAMQTGTQLRERYKRGDFYALLAIDFISAKRIEIDNKTSPLKRNAHVIRSLKHVDEVEALRQVYGRGFFLLGVSASIESRKHYLKELKGVPEHELDRVIERDDKEKLDLGQQTRDVFQMADAFVNTDDAERLSVQLGRIIDLLFSKPVVPPTHEEYAMFMAYAASLRSADLSRQVGAVIMNEYSDIVSTGANDVPKFGGGLYWPTDGDRRDYKQGFDSNQREKNNIVEDVIDCIKGCLPSDQRELNLNEIRAGLRKSRIMDLTEFGRAVHAEMESLLQAARNGVSVRGATLYTTTFPCHNCAKHIVASGIKEVVFIEPYPKSYAQKLHSDSISANGLQDEEKVTFRQFVGVGPRRFVDLFSMYLSSGRKLKRKSEDSVVQWDRKEAELRVPMTPLSYLEAEVLLVRELDEMTKMGKEQ
jgi:deoxycytidylate deaminase